MSLLPFGAMNVVAALLSMQRQKNIVDLIKNILICALNINEGLSDLEWHEGE